MENNSVTRAQQSIADFFLVRSYAKSFYTIVITILLAVFVAEFYIFWDPSFVSNVKSCPFCLLDTIFFPIGIFGLPPFSILQVGPWHIPEWGLYLEGGLGWLIYLGISIPAILTRKAIVFWGLYGLLVILLIGDVLVLWWYAAY
ncbi:MAG: hypothetical protein WA821_11015 [Anaerolineales bacterium]